MKKFILARFYGPNFPQVRNITYKYVRNDIRDLNISRTTVTFFKIVAIFS